MGTQTSKVDAQTEKAASFDGRSNGTVQALMPAESPSAPSTQTAPPPALTRRSQTMPMLTAEAKLHTKEKAKPSLTIDPSKVMDKDDDVSKSSICLSPSWSDHGKKKAKKAKKLEEKERKKNEEQKREAEKKAKKEAEKQKAAASKAGKREGRLNKKPPPAAMETQRMPPGLRQQSDSRRSSILSTFSSAASSADNSRRSSRDLKRLSIVSTGSSNDKRRSQSTPASSTEIEDPSGTWRPVVSAAAPQLPALPKLGLHSRNGSLGERKSNSWGSEEAYNRELVNYANHLNQGFASPQQPNFDGNLAPGPQHSRPLLRSQTDTALMTISQNRPLVKEVPRAVAERKGSDDSYRSRPNGAQGTYQNLGPNGTGRPETTKDGIETQATGSGQSVIKNAQHSAIHPLQANPTQIISSLDGGSYVHKERMRKQQQSLKGFNDEQAIRYATRTLDDDEEDDPQDTVIALSKSQEAEISHHEAEEFPPVPSIPAVQDAVSSTESVDQYHNYLKESQDAQDAVVLCNPDSMPTKRHTFLGMGFRSKPVKQPKHSSMAGSRSRSSEDTEDAKPSQPPRLHTSNLEASPRLSKAERMLGQAPPQTVPPQTPIGRSRLSQAVVDKERSPTGKANSPIQGRTKLANAIVDKESPPGKKETPPVPARSSTSQDGIIKEPQVQGASLVRSHSRTRTSSSQLLNDNVSLPRALPRSTTAPVLPTFHPEPFLLDHGATAAAGPGEMYEGNAQANDHRLRSHANPQLTAAEDYIPRPQGSRELAQGKSGPKPVPELVIEGVSPEGIVRKTSLKRPRSNPQLQVTSPTPPVPSLDFLPQLKHQPLVKPKPRSHLRNSLVPDSEAARPSSSQFPVPAAPMHNALPPSNNSAPNLIVTPPRSPKRPTSQQTPLPHTGEPLITQRPLLPPKRMSTGGRPSGLGKTVAKLIVTCCSCTRWIDLPSDLYKAMALPVRFDGEGRLETAVQCPWCGHCMTTQCCSSDTWVCNKHKEYH